MPFAQGLILCAHMTTICLEGSCLHPSLPSDLPAPVYRVFILLWSCSLVAVFTEELRMGPPSTGRDTAISAHNFLGRRNQASCYTYCRSPLFKIQSSSAKTCTLCALTKKTLMQSALSLLVSVCFRVQGDLVQLHTHEAAFHPGQWHQCLPVL